MTRTPIVNGKILDPMDVLHRLAENLAETHRNEVMAQHHGDAGESGFDDDCLYCQALADAEVLGWVPQPEWINAKEVAATGQVPEWLKDRP